MDEQFEKILGHRFAGRVREIEVAIGRRDSCNVVWTNRVKTTKYHFATFIVENLWEQFHLFANSYFVGVAILQLIPSTSDSDGLPTVLISLVPILLLKMFIDGLQDYQRHRNDQKTNMKSVKRVIQSCGDFSCDKTPCFAVEDTTWETLRVGDVIQISHGEEIPADCLMLYASDPRCRAYVETKNLDGESNLKIKSPIPELQKLIAAEPQPLCSWPCGARLNYGVPSSLLYSFNGQMLMGTNILPLSIDNLLLRGSTLRSQTVTAVVVYTGHMTRVYCNSSTISMKASRINQWINRHVLMLVCIQVSFCLMVAVASALAVPSDETWYLYGTASERDPWLFLKTLGRMLLLFSFYVPISLLLSLEVVRMVYKLYIERDECMQEKDGSSVEVNNRNVLEDMGIVSHIFTDKTGTLTENLMTFCAVAMPTAFLQCCLLEEDRPTKVSNCLPFCNPTFPAEYVHAAVSEASPQTQDDFALYVIALAVCHTAEIRTDDDGTESLDGPSPDELALICGAQVLGIRFIGRPTSLEVSLSLSEKGKLLWNRAIGLYGGIATEEDEVTVTLCHVLEFDNERKRMSVVVDIKGVKLLLCKGADNTMLEVRGQQSVDEIEWLEKHLFDLSVLGLRTLLIGVRAIPTEEYTKWEESWKKANTMTNVKASEAAVIQCMASIECDLRLVGVTGVEDQLQDEVSETLSAVQRAGIKTWVLTGDKVETAVNIAKSCGLITPTTYTANFQGVDVRAIRKQLEQVKKFLLAGKQLRTHGFRLDWAKEEKKAFALEMRKSEAESSNCDNDTTNDSKLTKCLSGASLHIVAGEESLQRCATVSFSSKEREGNRKQRESLRSSTMQEATAQSSPSIFRRHRTIAHVLGVEDGADVAVFDTVSIVITGECMHAILHNLLLRRDFFQLALSSCHSVICCRSTPLQKSLVVIWSQLYLESKNKAMLAIGDGTNDVGMIASARVGLGIRGKEGSQAARAADISIPQFKYLRRLLFVHGRDAWRRNTYVVYFNCFKNVAFCTVDMYFNTISKFSGGSIYDSMLKQGFNICLAAWPVMIFAMFDAQFPVSILYRSTRLYGSACAARCSHRKLLYWLATAFSVAATCLYLPVVLYDAPLVLVRHCVFLAILVPCNIILLWDSFTMHWFNWVFILSGFTFYLILSSTMHILWKASTLSENSLTDCFMSLKFWFVLLLTSVVSCFSHSIYTGVVSLAATPARAIRCAWDLHKDSLKRKCPDWRAEAKSDKHFFTRDFDPDAACDALLGKRELQEAAVVPAAAAKNQRRPHLCMGK